MADIDDPRIEPLARALCKARGNYPDDAVIDGGLERPRITGRRDHLVINPGEVVAVWTLWVPEAKAALAHIDQKADRAGS
jgi:predicted phosphodiesterase